MIDATKGWTGQVNGWPVMVAPLGQEAIEELDAFAEAGGLALGVYRTADGSLEADTVYIWDGEEVLWTPGIPREREIKTAEGRACREVIEDVLSGLSA